MSFLLGFGSALRVLQGQGVKIGCRVGLRILIRQGLRNLQRFLPALGLHQGASQIVPRGNKPGVRLQSPAKAVRGGGQLAEIGGQQSLSVRHPRIAGGKGSTQQAQFQARAHQVAAAAIRVQQVKPQVDLVGIELHSPL